MQQSNKIAKFLNVSDSFVSQLHSDPRKGISSGRAAELAQLGIKLGVRGVSFEALALTKGEGLFLLIKSICDAKEKINNKEDSQ